MRKALYIIIGSISVVLGIIGIVVPGLPTTPFLLLSSWLFYRSSPKLHDAIHRSKWLGPYIRKFEKDKGVDKKTKLISVISMWAMISLSAFVFIESRPIRWLLFGLGIIGSISVIFIVPNPQKIDK